MARLLALASLRAAYDPNQPRDKDGKWTDAVGFESDAWARYPKAPRADSQDLNDAINAALDANMMTEDGEIVLYHSTIHNPRSIIKKGLIPSFEAPSGQDWQADHSSYATYFHLDREVAERDIEYGGAVIEARVPLTVDTLERFLPDEDTSDDKNYGLANIIRKGGAVAFVGGVPSSALKVTKKVRALRAAFDPNQPRDEDGRWTAYHGTSLEAALKIKDEGLKPGAFHGKVFASKEIDLALWHGAAVTKKGGSVAVVILKPEAVDLFDKEEKSYLEGSKKFFETDKHVPASAIQEIRVYDAKKYWKSIFSDTPAPLKYRTLEGQLVYAFPIVDELRAASTNHPIRTAADQGERKILIAVRTAGVVASRVAPDRMPDAFAASLRRTLPGALARVAMAGTKASELPAARAAESHKFSSVQIELTGKVSEKLLAMAARIGDEDLAPKGRETEPHVTVRWGLHQDSAPRALLEQWAPITMTFGQTSVFEGEEFDVIKVDVVSPQLLALNAELASLPNTETHKYSPHATLAYVKPGLGRKYSGMTDLDGVSFEAAEVVFSDTEDARSVVHLTGLRVLKSRDPLSAAASAWAKKHTAELVTGIAETTRERIAKVVSKQLPDARTHAELVKIVKDSKRAQLIARTESMIAAHQGQHLVWAQAVEDGLLDADFKRRWIFTDDEVGCPQCEALDGKLAEAEGEYEPGVSMPPAHPNCLLPGAEVSGRIVAGLEARYSGPAIEIKTFRGNALRVTPNHQILTSEGWIAASELRQGMQLFSDQGDSRNGTSFGEIDDYKRPALVEDVIQALRLRGFTAAKPSRLDLHGDARWVDGEVDVVGANRELRKNVQPARSQESDDFRFPLTDSFEPCIRGVGTANLHLERVLLPAPSEPTSLHLSDDLSAVGLQQTPLDPLLLGRSSKWDVCSFEGVRQDVAANAAFLGELQKRSAGQIAGDEVVEVRNFEFSGQVYELQSEVGWIIAQNIVISNCRCTEGLAL